MFNPMFDPGKVALGGNPTGPYMPRTPGVGGLPQGPGGGGGGGSSFGPPTAKGPIIAPPRPTAPVGAAPSATSQGNVLGSEAVRATGSGPYDQGYRQDLATYAGGNFQRPGGYLGFNPTGNLFGNPSGGGNAPALGNPTDIFSQALSGQGFSFTPPPPAPTTPKAKPQLPGNMNFWLDNYGGSGRTMRTF